MYIHYTYTHRHMYIWYGWVRPRVSICMEGGRERETKPCHDLCEGKDFSFWKAVAGNDNPLKKTLMKVWRHIAGLEKTQHAARLGPLGDRTLMVWCCKHSIHLNSFSRGWRWWSVGSRSYPWRSTRALSLPARDSSTLILHLVFSLVVVKYASYFVRSEAKDPKITFFLMSKL